MLAYMRPYKQMATTTSRKTFLNLKDDDGRTTTTTPDDDARRINIHKVHIHIYIYIHFSFQSPRLDPSWTARGPLPRTKTRTKKSKTTNTRGATGEAASPAFQTNGPSSSRQDPVKPPVGCVLFFVFRFLFLFCTKVRIVTGVLAPARAPFQVVRHFRKM